MKISYKNVNVGDVLVCRDGEWRVMYKTPTTKRMRNMNGFFNFLAERPGTATKQLGGNSYSGSGGTINDWKNVYLKDVYSINGIVVK